MEVEITYRDGSSPKTFTVEELEDIEERIELGPDWIIVTLNRSRRINLRR